MTLTRSPAAEKLPSWLFVLLVVCVCTAALCWNVYLLLPFLAAHRYLMQKSIDEMAQRRPSLLGYI